MYVGGLCVNIFHRGERYLNGKKEEKIKSKNLIDTKFNYLLVDMINNR
jgi:hypothetical protein